MQKQVANSTQSSFTIAPFTLEPEKQKTIQILNQKLHKASDFD